MDDVLTELRLLSDANDRYNAAQRNYNNENTRQHGLIWDDVAELREQVLALSNRIESLTQARPHAV